jgi:hypothetical protein
VGSPSPMRRALILDWVCQKYAIPGDELMLEVEDALVDLWVQARAALAAAPSVGITHSLPLDVVRESEQQAFDYLGRLLEPHCEPLPTLVGRCTQIDNLLTLLPGTLEPTGPDALDESGSVQSDPKPMQVGSPSSPPLVLAVERVVDQLRDRAALGLAKYGTTMDRRDYSHRDWLQHAQEEVLDLALYLERCLDVDVSTPAPPFDWRDAWDEYRDEVLNGEGDSDAINETLGHIDNLRDLVDPDASLDHATCEKLIDVCRGCPDCGSKDRAIRNTIYLPGTPDRYGDGERGIDCPNDEFHKEPERCPECGRLKRLVAAMYAATQKHPLTKDEDRYMNRIVREVRREKGVE